MSNKCCYCVKLDLGCILIGLVSVIFSITMTITSAVYLTKDIGTNADVQPRDNATLAKTPPLVYVKLFGNMLEIPVTSLHIILYSSLVLEIMLMIASISLLIGLKKRKPGYILFYFGFGIFFVIFSQLGGLLMILQKKWEFSLIVFIISVLYIHFLVVVHAVYEDTLNNGHLYSSNSVVRLVEEDTLSTITIDADSE